MVFYGCINFIKNKFQKTIPQDTFDWVSVADLE